MNKGRAVTIFYISIEGINKPFETDFVVYLTILANSNRPVV